ncbi:thioredoxin family protein [Oculatella sp. LEGE 06141]|uniref:thioredoxin family protein n=1 Tax=Oculatella sp. LEGE 06141 TaxID=1828648 RepID=UPI0018831161|nr:thioredoxin family protein [Oculatella sp. LEGE 06141]MBE9178447.1 thioredoxin family protein [Oculatella sp. LEGE 06141]
MEMGTAIGSYAPDFELPGIDNAVHHLGRYLGRYQAVGVIIMCNHCPSVRLYLDRLKQIQTEFQNQGFTLIGINANDDRAVPEDSFEQMKRFAAEQQLNFPYLRDMTQDVAHGFGAQRTPEAYLLDQSSALCYRGAIDDNPQSAQAVQTFYLRDAIAQLLAGKAITLNSTEPTGCSIKWRQ